MKKPLLFLGHCQNIHRHIEMALDMELDPIGIIDDNYFGNTPVLDDLPVVGTEENLGIILERWPDALYFIAVPGTVGGTADQKKCNVKREKMIRLSENLPITNLIHRTAVINPRAKFGRGIYVDAFSRIQSDVILDDFCSIKEQSCIAHHAKIGHNVSICHQVYIGSHVQIEKNCYIGIKSMVMGVDQSITLGEGCVTHPGVIVLRSQEPGTIARISTSNGTGIHQPTIS